MRYVVIGAGWLWGLFALPEVTDAGMDFGVPVALAVTGGAVGIVWGVYSVAVPAVFRTPRVRWTWLSVPVIGLGTLLLSFSDAPLAARVWLCESGLRGYAETVRQNPAAVTRWTRVGLFRVRETTADEHQVLLHTASALWTTSGIAYRPDGAPPAPAGGYKSVIRSRHLYGPWWRFDEVRD